MKFAAVLFLAVAVGAAKLKPSFRAQVGGEGSPVVLDNQGISGAVGALSQVDVACSGGQVQLTLTNTGEPAIAGPEAQIILGAGGVGCDSGREAVPRPGGLVFSTGANLCGRVGNANTFTWNVEVTEWYNRPGFVTELGPYTATFSVTCDQSAVQPTEVPSQTQPPAVTEGSAQFSGSVQFSLAAAASSNARQWVLELQPTDVPALRGLSYTINTLTASTGDGSAGLTTNLIENGCVRDTLGVQVEIGAPADQKTTIRVTAFQFSQSRGTPIDFTATVLLCTPDAPGEVCAPVTDADTCAAPTVPTVPTVPTEPTVPTVPTEPAEPTEPTVPTVPTEPAEPTVPTVPTEPTEPTVPTEEPVETGDGARRIRRSLNRSFGVRIGKLVAKSHK